LIKSYRHILLAFPYFDFVPISIEGIQKKFKNISKPIAIFKDLWYNKYKKTDDFRKKEKLLNKLTSR